MNQVVVFTATRWELNAVRRAMCVERRDRIAGSRWILGHRGHTRLSLVQTGVGPEKAGAACREILRRHPVDLAMSAGFACALIPSQVGELLIGTEVTAHPDTERVPTPAQAPGGTTCRPFPCFAAATALACRSAAEAGLALRTGGFVSVPRVLWRAEDKRAVAARTGAIGLDMESAAIGAVATAHRVPFLIVRTVSDLVDEDLPLDFNLFQGPTGWAKGVVAAVTRPSCLIGFSRLRGQAAVAAAHLTRFCERFFDALD